MVLIAVFNRVRAVPTVTSCSSQPLQRFDDSLDLLGALGVLSAEAGGELVGGGGGVGG